MPKVVVVGSLNVDYLASVDRLPLPGQTVPANSLIRRFGGKGANQAVAAARQGARVAMVGCVGADEAGRAYCRRLRQEGINTAGIATAPSALTGTALIAVDHAAENMIIVAAGANGRLTPAHVRAQRYHIASADLLLLQLEVPMPSVIEAVRIANRAAVPAVFNPSPWRSVSPSRASSASRKWPPRATRALPGFPWGTCRLDTLITNAGEAEAIFGLKSDRIRAEIQNWRRGLQRRNVDRLIITRGSRSTIYLSATAHFVVPTLQVKPLDTVGAGDAFAGVYAARRADQADVKTAIAFANCAGALTTLARGAQEAIPNRAATDRAFLRL